MTGSLRLQVFGRPPWPLLFGIAATGQVLVLAMTERGVQFLFCGSAGWLVAEHPAAAISLALTLVGPTALGLGWLVMLGVMMPPVLR